MPAVWVASDLKAEIAYRGVTTSGELRHASFKGLADQSSAMSLLDHVPQERTRPWKLGWPKKEPDMDDNRVWAFEESLWTGDAEHYRELIDDECVMVLPDTPFVFTGARAVTAVADTPRWSKVAFSAQQIMRPQEGLIVIAYKAEATRDASADYEAFCTTTLRRLEHDVWRVVQHQQTLPPIVGASS